MRKIIIAFFTALIAFGCNENSSNKPASENDTTVVSNIAPNNFKAGAALAGNTYYISPSGNDAGNGSAATPWKTLFKATTTVQTAGDIIHVNPGTYTETQNSSLAAGVNLEGADSATTFIKSTKAGDWSVLLTLQSNEGTNGNQTVSGLTFDGNYVSETSFKTWWAIEVRGRSNVTIRDCHIKSFYDRGVVFDGNNVQDPTNYPSVYATGNKFYNNKLTNTARNSPNYIAGMFNFGGQDGMEIYNNTMIQTQRPLGKNGEPIKMWDNGFNRGCRIHHNILKRLPLSAKDGEGQGDWTFAIELFNSAGLEVDNNTIEGAVDINYNYPLTYAYSIWLHDNNIGFPAGGNQKMDCGFILEFATIKAVIENNKITNVACGFLFNVRTPTESGGYTYPPPTGGYSATNDVTIRNNLFTGLYDSYAYGNCCGGVGVRYYVEHDNNDPYARDIKIQNNTFVGRTGATVTNFADFSNFSKAGASGDRITVSKNIFVGCSGPYVSGTSTYIKNFVLTDNNAWQCGNNNQSGFTGTYTNTGNTAVNPNFDANYVSSLPIGYKPAGTPPPNNTPPTANAGDDVTITLPVNSVTLTGSGSDPDGSIASYQWKAGTNVVATTNVLVLSNLVAGDYDFTLTVTDNLGAVSTPDAVHVKVNPATPPPPSADTVLCSIIIHLPATGNIATKRNLTYFVKRSDGVYYDNTGTKLDVIMYKRGNKWYSIF